MIDGTSGQIQRAVRPARDRVGARARWFGAGADARGATCSALRVRRPGQGRRGSSKGRRRSPSMKHPAICMWLTAGANGWRSLRRTPVAAIEFVSEFKVRSPGGDRGRQLDQRIGSRRGAMCTSSAPKKKDAPPPKNATSSTSTARAPGKFKVDMLHALRSKGKSEEELEDISGLGGGRGRRAVGVLGRRRPASRSQPKSGQGRRRRSCSGEARVATVSRKSDSKFECSARRGSLSPPAMKRSTSAYERKSAERRMSGRGRRSARSDRWSPSSMARGRSRRADAAKLDRAEHDRRRD